MKSRICFLKKHKSIKFIDNKQGSVMAMVVVAVAVLTILSSMFIVSAFYNYRLGRTISYSESAYLGAEAAAERWYGTIRDILTAEDGKYIGIDFPMEYGKEEEYVLSVLERIRVYGFTDDHEDLEKDDDKEINDKIRELIKDDSELVDLINEKFEPELRIRGERERIINVRFGRFEVYDADRVVSTPEQAKDWGIREDMQVVKASVGFVLVAQVESSTGEVLSEANRVFVQKDIYVPYYEQIQALGATYSMGDIIAIGDEDPNSDEQINLYGDVYSFGTFPKTIAVREQWTYGGVMAVDDAKLNIKGNVLTRSFLRAGKREYQFGAIDDSSRIIVERDVMAQGIQTFSNGSKMYIYGNAYTLDDLEINAEDSIIAVNRNYIGLSADRDARLHDQTSSILNSGILHDGNHTEPTRSRIVINGDILVPGVSWRIDSSGVAEEPIESVGLLFPYAEGGDTSGEFVSSSIPSYRHIHFFNDGEYQAFLRDRDDHDLLQLGYSTIIQAWDVIDDGYDAWKDEIDTVIEQSADNHETYGNLGGVWDSLANVEGSSGIPFGLNIVNEISGLVVGMVGANNSLYWDELFIGESKDPNKNQLAITGLSENLEENFKIFGFMPSEIKRAFDDGHSHMEKWVIDGGDLAKFDFNKETSRDEIEAGNLKTSIERFWNHFWKPWDINVYEYWDTYMEHALLDASDPPDDLDDLDTRDLLLDESDSRVYARRRVLLNLVANRLNRILWRGLPDSDVDAGDEWGTEVNDDLEHLFEKIERLKTRGGGTGVVIGDIGSAVDDDLYYLLVNEDPDEEIFINTTFRGIIVTRGNVRMGRGGTVYGTIFAVGDKDDPFNAISTDPGDLEWNLEALNKGDFAGIVLDLNSGDPDLDPPKIDFYLGNHSDPKFDSVIGPQRGRIQLLEEFRNQSPSVDLYQIF